MSTDNQAESNESLTAVAGQTDPIVKASDFGLLADIVDPGKNLEREWDRQKSLEQRGISIITSAGAFVTLVFAVAALITKFKGAKNFDAAEIAFIVASMGAFVFAGLSGIWVNKPEDYGAVRRDVLQNALSGNSDVNEIRKQANLAIGQARDVNAAKARRLVLAIGLQVLAVTFLVTAVIIIVLRGRLG